MRLVRAATYGRKISDAEMCEYSSRKWCSTDQTYFKPCRSQCYRQLELAHQARVLGADRVGLDLVPRDVRLNEESEFHS